MLTTASTWHGKPLTLDDIQAAVDRLKAIPQNDQWILVDPQGQMYKGRAEEVMRHLLPHHPLLKPLSLRDVIAQEMDCGAHVHTDNGDGNQTTEPAP